MTGEQMGPAETRRWLERVESRLQGIENRLDSDRYVLRSVHDVQMQAAARRIEALEENARWMFRLVVGTIVAFLMKIIFDVASTFPGA